MNFVQHLSGVATQTALVCKGPGGLPLQRVRYSENHSNVAGIGEERGDARRRFAAPFQFGSTAF